MSNNETGNTFLILAGATILAVFTYISILNILPNNSSDSYYSKNDAELSVIINDVKFENGKINVLTSENNVYVCVKQTKSLPKVNSICWKKAKNNSTEFSAFEGKTYFIWLKDENNTISDYMEYNTNIKEIE